MCTWPMGVRVPPGKLFNTLAQVTSQEIKLMDIIFSPQRKPFVALLDILSLRFATYVG